MIQCTKIPLVKDSKLIQELKEQVVFELQKGNWVVIESVMKESPQLFSDIINRIAEIFRKLESQDPVQERKQVKRNEQIVAEAYLKSSYINILTLIQKFSNMFDDRLKKDLVTRILPVGDLFIDHFKLFVHALGSILTEEQAEIFLDIPQYLTEIIEINSKIVEKHYKCLIQRKYYREAYKLLKKNPSLARGHPKLTIRMFKTNIINNREVTGFIALLEKCGDSQILKWFKKSRDEVKYEFLENLKVANLDTGNFWNRVNHYSFTENLDLFSNADIDFVLKSLIDLNIPNSYIDAPSSYVMNMLFEISISGKREVFKKYIGDLVKLGYHQIVKEFFEKFPQIIQDYPKDIIESISPYFLFDLIKEYPREFDSFNVNALFSKIFPEFRRKEVIISFWEYFPKSRKDFARIVTEFFEKIDFSDEDGSRPNFAFLSLMIENLNLPDTGFLFELEFIEKKLKQWISNPKHHKYFFLYSGSYLVKNFQRLDPILKDQLLDLLFSTPDFYFLYQLAKGVSDVLVPRIKEVILLYKKRPGDLGWYLGVLTQIIINNYENKELSDLIKESLIPLPDHHLKAQLLSYLGDHKQTADIFKRLSQENKTLTGKCINFLDYKIEETEVQLSIFDLREIELEEETLSSISLDFEKYNENNQEGQRFKFKRDYLLARLCFIKGTIYLEQEDPQTALDLLQKSKNDLKQMLEKYPNIPDQTKDEISCYRDILLIFIDSAKALMLSRSLNQEFLQIHLYDPISTHRTKLSPLIPKIDRIFNQILTNLKKNQIRISLEPLASFCPNPPRIKEYSLMPASKIGIANENNISAIQGLNPICHWDANGELSDQQSSIQVVDYFLNFVFLIELQNDLDYLYTFAFQIIPNPNIECIPPTLKCMNKMQFEFPINLRALTPFKGKLDLQVVIGEESLCRKSIKLKFPVERRSDQKSPEEIKELLLYELIENSAKLQRRANSIKPGENNLSFILTDLLDSSIKNLGYRADSNTPAGKSNYSSKRKRDNGVGELDIVIRDSQGQFVTICEALILTTLHQKYIQIHLKKLFDYDANGLPFNFIIVYSKIVDFLNGWSKYKNIVLETNFKYPLITKTIQDIEDINNSYAEIKIGKSLHSRKGIIVEIIHLFINYNAI